MAAELDISTHLKTSILEPIDAAVAAKIISETPFIAVPGVSNVRGLGGLPVTNPQQESDGQVPKTLEVKSGRLFRSAQLNDINKAGREKLSSLNIGAIFDLRTTAEVRKYAGVPEDDLNPSAGFLEFTEENIDLRHIPMKDMKKIDQKEQMAMLAIYGSGDDGFLKGYDEMLDIAGESYGAIMRYILEQIRRGDDGKACIWHCHVGKDRTGVFSALLLDLLGVPDEAIAQDYALTRAGLEPIRLQLLEQWKDLVTKYPQVTASLAASNATMMMRFLEHVRTKYGGGRGWFLKKAGLTEEELDEIRAGLVVEAS